ncbi:hypothetical protein [Streptomyces caniscabiei]|jgi:hypothetical protein|uniref:Uncharacterized protein n=1 Tax=Streptomyces caniscabiei TaxID=2746961 RepID=A0ABU4MQL1_9ACTN|nr:hypothetical protein [Streptomyces caniscabiei]MDX2954580.1 hypothetical protein [Streptomyces caniscabiei]MDX2986554.1 hypothetical protein [Streptomyces caniscabiei]MDX3039431.1 hypothetical protein [Streptomyces caniscabiei]
MGHATDQRAAQPTPRTEPLPSAAQAALARLQRALRQQAPQ